MHIHVKFADYKMAEQVKSFIGSAITPIASFVLFDVLNVNFFLGYLGLALETLEEDQEELQLESKRKIEAEEVRQRKKIKPSEDLANMEGEEIRDEEEERPGSRQKIWNLRPEINFTESLKMEVNFSGPKKYIAPTESFEGDILKDVNDVEAEEAAGTGSDVVFVSNVDVVNNPYHFESVTQYVVIPKDEIEAKFAEGEVRVEKTEASPEDYATSEEVVGEIEDKSASHSSYTEEELTIVEGKEASSEEIIASEDVGDVTTVEIEAKSVSQPSDQPPLVELNSEDAVVETDGGAGFLDAKSNPALDVGFLESSKQKPNTEKLMHLILGRNPKVTSEQADLYIQKLRTSMNGKLTGLTVQEIVKGVEALMRTDGLARRKVVKETLDETDPVDPPTSSGDKKKPEDTEKLLHQILARNPQLTSEQADLYIQKLRASRNSKLSGLSVQDIIKGVDALIREDGLARRGVVEENLDEIEAVGVFESSKHGDDDDTVLISTQDLTKLVKEVASASLQDPIAPMDCSQDDTILITTQDLDAILKEDMKLKEDEVEATGLSPVEENSTEATSGEKNATTGNVDESLGLVEGIKNAGISINEPPQNIIDAGNNEIPSGNRKQSEIVDVESDDNEGTQKDSLVEEVPHGITDPNGSVESAGSLEVGMEAAEDAFVVIDKASDLLTDKTNIIIPKSLGDEDDEEKVEVISVVGDKENKSAGTKSSGKNKKGKNKKKVF